MLTKLSEEELENLSEANIEKFLLLFKASKISPATLSFAAEILGRKSPESVAISYLKALTQHEHPLVREGAILGLSHYDSSAAKELIISLTTDPIVEVSIVANNALQYFT